MPMLPNSVLGGGLAVSLCGAGCPPSTLKHSFGSQHRMKMPFGSCPCSLPVLEICPEVVWNGVVGPGPNDAVK